MGWPALTDCIMGWKDFIGRFRIVIILCLLVIIFYTGAAVVYPAVSKMAAEKSPVVGLEAVNRKEYTAGRELQKRDFEVRAVHENGMESGLSENEFKLSTDKVNPYGKYTEITVMLKADKNMSCTVKVKNVREKVEVFACGSPEINAVKAVVYSNGEMCFEGAGDILQFNEGEFPWQESEEDIKYVTFEKGVAPVSMDYFFEDMEALEYVDPIPATVTSMAGTFSGCTALADAPDWNKCQNLLDLSECYEECSALISVPAIPGSVRTMTAAFSECSSLQTAPDMSGAESVTTASSAFEDCTQLAETGSMPPAMEEAAEMFSGCINLKEMPEIPESMTNMNAMFSGAQSLSTLTAIPANVQDVGSCFENCRKINGVLWVDGNPEEFSGCFEGAAVATSVDLQGNSSIMDALANTGTSVTVNGNMPDPEITDYDDVFADEQQ